MRAEMTRMLCLLLLALGLGEPTPVAANGALMVVANADTPALDEDTLQKIYLGKVVEVNGKPIIPVNLAKGSALRKAFMERILAQDDDKFIAYWTVRRYIGKGSPPREFASVELQLEFLRATPGAVGYFDDSIEVKSGLKTILKKP
jgi:ABC-type phosphate transport system substrate-binding protein